MENSAPNHRLPSARHSGQIFPRYEVQPPTLRDAAIVAKPRGACSPRGACRGVGTVSRGCAQVLRERAFDLLLPLLPHPPAGSGRGHRRYRPRTLARLDLGPGRANAWPNWSPPQRRANPPRWPGHLFAGPDRLSAKATSAGPGAGRGAAVLGFVMEPPTPARICRRHPDRFCTALPGRWQAVSARSVRFPPPCATPRRASAPWWRRPTPMARSAACRCWSWPAKSCGPAWRSRWSGSPGAGALLVDRGGTLPCRRPSLPLGSDAMLRLLGARPDDRSSGTVSAAALLDDAPSASAALAPGGSC